MILKLIIVQGHYSTKKTMGVTILILCTKSDDVL